jgi:hypothetical protein
MHAADRPPKRSSCDGASPSSYWQCPLRQASRPEHLRPLQHFCLSLPHVIAGLPWAHLPFTHSRDSGQPVKSGGGFPLKGQHCLPSLPQSICLHLPLVQRSRFPLRHGIVPLQHVFPVFPHPGALHTRRIVSLFVYLAHSRPELHAYETESVVRTLQHVCSCEPQSLLAPPPLLPHLPSVHFMPSLQPVKSEMFGPNGSQHSLPSPPQSTFRHFPFMHRSVGRSRHVISPSQHG